MEQLIACSWHAMPQNTEIFDNKTEIWDVKGERLKWDVEGERLKWDVKGERLKYGMLKERD